MEGRKDYEKILVAILLVTMMVLSVSACDFFKLETKPYTVTFDTDGGSAVEPQTVNEGAKATKPADPTKEGHTFIGWYVGDAEYKFDSAVTADVTVKAKWEKNAPPAPTTFTVEFDADGGSAVEPQTVNEGATAEKPVDPTKTGFTFVGWYAGETEYNFDTPVTADVNLKAVWLQNTHSVTFDTDGGSAVETQIVNEGATAEKPADPTKDGYIFAGWFDGDVEYDFTAAVATDVDLKAKWIYNLEWNEIIGAWTATYTGDLYGVPVTQVYNFVFFTDGTATAVVNNDMMGTTYDEELVFTSIKIENGTLSLTYASGIMNFVYEGGKLIETAKGIEATPKSIAADIVGTWVGNEDYSGVQIPYTVTIAADGTVTGSCDMFGYIYDFELVSLDNKLVISAMGAMQTILVYDGEKLVGTGVMGGAITMTPYVEPTESITLDMLTGTWTGDENAYGMAFTYVFVINADGTGSAKYSSGEYETVMFLEKFEVVDNKLVINYKNYEYDEVLSTLEFSYADGKLVGVGIMAGELTLEKSEADVEEPQKPTLETIAGIWTGTEVTDYGNYVYNVTINADGTGTGVYADESGAYPSDMEITGIAIEGSTVTLTYLSYDMEYTIVFTYENGTLSSDLGAMWGKLTLTKQA